MEYASNLGSTPAPPRRPGRNRLETVLFSWPAQDRNDEPLEEVAPSASAQPSAFSAVAASLRAVAGGGKPRKSAVERADRGATGNARGDRHGQAACDASTQRPACPISRLTRSGELSAESPGNAAGSDEKSEGAEAPS